MQRLLDAVGIKNDSPETEAAGGERVADTTAERHNQETTPSSSQAPPDLTSPVAQTPVPQTTESKAEAPPAAPAPPQISPTEASNPDSVGFVVLSDPTTEGDNAYTVYSAEQLEQEAPHAPTATMAASSSSSTNPNGVPQINWPPTEDEMKGRDGPRMGNLKSSRAFSIASAASDKSRREPLRANNPGSIPTAGGQALGGRAMEERERRRSRMSLDMGKAPADRDGAPDAITQNNTEANIVPARMNQDNGEGSSKITPPALDDADKSLSAPAVSSSPPILRPANYAPQEPPAAETAAAENAASETPKPKERRGSTLDSILGKLKIGSKNK